MGGGWGTHPCYKTCVPQVKIKGEITERYFYQTLSLHEAKFPQQKNSIVGHELVVGPAPAI